MNTKNQLELKDIEQKFFENTKTLTQRTKPNEAKSFDFELKDE